MREICNKANKTSKLYNCITGQRQGKLYYATLKSYGVVVPYNSLNPMTVILYAKFTFQAISLNNLGKYECHLNIF